LGIVALANLIFDHDMIDRNVVAWDRNRNIYCPLFAMFTNIITDLVVVKLMPALIAGCVFYYPCNLKRTWHAFEVFLQFWLMIHLVGACFSRVIFALMAISHKFEQARAAVSTTSSFFLMVLYAGFIYNLGCLPSDKNFLRAWSIFYW